MWEQTVMFGKHGSDVIKRGQIINIIIIHINASYELLTLPFKGRNLAVITILYEKWNQFQVQCIKPSYPVHKLSVFMLYLCNVNV
jgi:hypothetical protein